MKFWSAVVLAARAIFLEVTGKIQIWAQAASGLANLAVMVFVICVVAEPRWAAGPQQLNILMYLGVIAALTNAVVVIALSRVNLSAHGPGNLEFQVDAGDGAKPAVAVAVAGSAQ